MLQATDAIVQAANRFGKPFAVVPCCVFPRQHAYRTLLSNDGQPSPVRLYQELVQYLQQQGGLQTRRAYLPFEGSNQVVFRTGAD